MGWLLKIVLYEDIPFRGASLYSFIYRKGTSSIIPSIANSSTRYHFHIDTEQLLHIFSFFFFSSFSVDAKFIT